MQIAIASTPATNPIRTPQATPPSNRAGSFANVLEQFLKVAYQTPAERARAAVLEKHDLDEASYAALPPEKRDAIDKEIADAVRKVTERDTGVPQDSSFVATLQQLGQL